MSNRYSAGMAWRATLALTILTIATLAISARPSTAKEDRAIQTTLVRMPEGHVVPVTTRRPLAPLAVGPVGTVGSAAILNIQSETSVAASGNLVVAGFNDFRFPANSVSGVIYSSDGGNTFTDGGQLPGPAGSQVLGDPVLAVYNPPVGPPVFYYSSIFFPAAGGVSQCVHRSTDGGVTWAGPFEVTSTTSATDALEDKEWITVDPETGRLFLAWTQFPAAGVDNMKVTYSDDGGVTWSMAALLGTNGQGSSVAADPNGPNVYDAWLGSGAINISRSTNNGTTWALTATVLAPAFDEVLPPYGFDRFNSFPSITVNPVDRAVELVYAASVDGTPASDFGDVYYRRSTDGGLTFTPPVALNTFPGTDRPQIFPTVSAASDGRIDVFWYDESAGSGVSDVTDVFYTFSTNFGASWSSPVPVTSKPFHNEVGNNYSAPHQGDYIDAATGSPTGYTCFAWYPEPNPLGTSADAFVAASTSPTQITPLRSRPGTVVASGRSCGPGIVNADDIVDLDIPLQNIGRSALAGISATLSSSTPGISILTGTRSYPPMASGASASPIGFFTIQLSSSYPCGTPANFRLDYSATGTTASFLELTLQTGVVASTTLLLAENFDGVTPPNLPAGWTTVDGCGAPDCASNPWTTTPVLPASAPNAAFCLDNPAASTFGRLFGPAVAVPASATYVDVSFDGQWNLEEQDARTGFDALSFGYQLDGVGATHFASADAIEFDNRYTHYVSRGSGAGSGDRSGYSGDSGGYRSIRIRIPNLAGHTLTPRFDLTTDSNTGMVGAWVDNVVIRAITMGCGSCQPVAALVQGFEASLAEGGVDLTWSSSATGSVTAWNLYRAEALDGSYARINSEAIPMGSGGEFRFHDPEVAGSVLYYQLKGVFEDGSERTLETAEVDLASSGSAFGLSLAGLNPFRKSTTVSYSLPARMGARLEVFSIDGRKVRTLLNRVENAGSHTLVFTLADGEGRSLGAGVYLLRLTAGRQRSVVRLVALE